MKQTDGNPERSEKSPSRALRPQVLMICACLILGTSMGMSLGHSAVLLPELQSNSSDLHVDEDTGSWIASVYAGAGPAGSLAAGVTVELWGRRRVAVAGSVISVLSWVLICAAQGPAALMLGRVIGGFSRSVMVTSLTVLIDEVADPVIRGFTFCSIIAMSSMGVMSIAGLGSMLSWRLTSGVGAIVAVLALFPFVFFHESPSWLVRKNRLDEALRGLRWLWGPTQEDQVREEFEMLKSRRYSQQDHRTSVMSKCVSSFRGFFKPHILKPFCIMHVFNTIQAFCGVFIFTFYAVDMLSRIREAGNDLPFNDHVSTVVMSLSRFLSNIAATLLVMRLGRRTIAMISGVGCSTSALGVGIILFLQNSGIYPSLQSGIVAWLNFVLMALFVFFYSFGFLFLPVLMLGETQASQVRSVVCGYVYTVNDITLSVVLKLYPSLMRSLEIDGLFLLFGFSCLLCLVFAYLFVPETQGKTLEQIEDYFGQPNIMWITRRKPQQDRESKGIFYYFFEF